MSESRPLADQIPRSAYTGMVFIDQPALDTLERLITGPVHGRADLALAEAALRGVLLHREAVSLQFPYVPNVPNLSKEPPAPQVTFSTNDPSIPPHLLDDVHAVQGMVSEYLTRQRQAHLGQPRKSGVALRRQLLEVEETARGLRAVLADRARDRAAAGARLRQKILAPSS